MADLLFPDADFPALDARLFDVPTQERLAVKSEPAWVLDLQRPTLNSLENFIVNGKFYCAEAQIASDSLNGAWGFTQFETVWLPIGVLGVLIDTIVQRSETLVLPWRKTLARTDGH